MRCENRRMWWCFGVMGIFLVGVLLGSLAVSAFAERQGLQGNHQYRRTALERIEHPRQHGETSGGGSHGAQGELHPDFAVWRCSTRPCGATRSTSIPAGQGPT
jgi:hypothetical protein